MAEPARARHEGDVDERLEVHRGESVPKEAARFQHSHAQAGMGFALWGPFQRAPGRGGPGGWWLASEAKVAYPGWTFIHDLAGWRRERVPVKPTGRPVQEVPDWVCEILSSNRRHDLTTKFDVLADAGVRHYWLVDVDERVIVVHRLQADGWLRAGAFAASEVGIDARIEPFEAVELELGVLLGDDPSE